jgi:hypothetical protein
MKSRTGFVSNSSSSSFILYGANFHGDEDVVDAIGKLLTEEQTQEALSKSRDWGNDKQPYESIKLWLEDDCYEVTESVNKYLPDGINIECDEGEWSIGSDQDPEYISMEQARNGFWTKEQMETVDKLLESIGKTASVFGGTRMC